MRDNFRALLLSDNDISGQVGTRVYPLKLPQDPTYPAITYQVISDQSERLLSGADRIRRARVQVDVWAETLLTCQSITNFVRTLLDGQDNTQGNIRFRSAWTQNGPDLYEESIEKYRITSDCELTYWTTP